MAFDLTSLVDGYGGDEFGLYVEFLAHQRGCNRCAVDGANVESSSKATVVVPMEVGKKIGLDLWIQKVKAYAHAKLSEHATKKGRTHRRR